MPTSRSATRATSRAGSAGASPHSTAISTAAATLTPTSTAPDRAGKLAPMSGVYRRLVMGMSVSVRRNRSRTIALLLATLSACVTARPEFFPLDPTRPVEVKQRRFRDVDLLQDGRPLDLRTLECAIAATPDGRARLDAARRTMTRTFGLWTLTAFALGASLPDSSAQPYLQATAVVSGLGAMLLSQRGRDRFVDAVRAYNDQFPSTAPRAQSPVAPASCTNARVGP